MDNNQMYDERVLTTKIQPSTTTTTIASPKTTTTASPKDSNQLTNGNSITSTSTINNNNNNNNNGTVTWDPEQQLWRAAILTENGNERPAGWFKSSNEANAFLQFLSSSQNSNNNQQQQQQQLPRQETIAMQPMYENKMKHLEHELVLSNNNGYK